MTELGSVAWPPAPVRTARLVLRESEARDRAAFIELFASPEVDAHIGGSRPRTELERSVPDVPGRRPGVFVVALHGTLVGMVNVRAPRRGTPGPRNGVRRGRTRLPVPAGGVGTRLRHRGVHGGTGLVRRRAPRRAGRAPHPGRERPRDATGGQARVHGGGTVRGVRRRPVVRRVVPARAVRLNPGAGGSRRRSSALHGRGRGARRPQRRSRARRVKSPPLPRSRPWPREARGARLGRRQAHGGGTSVEEGSG